MDARQGYAEAKQLLKKHFGNEVKVTNAYLEKALSWTAIKADDGKALQAYALYLRGCYNAMQDLEYLKELDIPSNLRLMTSKLRDKWRTAAHDTMVQEGTTHLDLPRVYTQDRIPVSKENIPTQNDLGKWPYLSGIQLDEMYADIDLLIGINVPKAMEP
ncbi:hypothetical protein AAFF_G00117340 [Aldrovandia affinis]|uniref:Uncharacterized protein n=1 Tax=Aldrovandia affinis TaxID=143900 RepID=A0AAD7WXP3_9TELE|nr:hypothetical protein AAFF_G00117340 [Aldrovandia affinis]